MPNEYSAALKLGRKSAQAAAAKKMPTQLPVLDEILATKMTAGEIPLGLVDIPMELIAGTKTRGRAYSFAPDFMPVLEEGTEFAAKWDYLYHAHLQEGIREPVKAYEYLNRYYILEGNKRVSVLKYCGARSVPGYVTRILPAWSDTQEIRLYYEFLDFYNATSFNDLILRHEGDYRRLTQLVGKQRYERWSPQERMDFRIAYNGFSAVYNSCRKESKDVSAADAMLVYLELFGYGNLRGASEEEIRENLGKIESYLRFEQNDRPVDLNLEPDGQERAKKSLLTRILPPAVEPRQLKVAFIHKKNAQTSPWTFSHENGRAYLERQFADSISCLVYDDVEGTSGAMDAISDAVAQGCSVIFTTTMEFLEASMKCAVQYPDVKILNCSLNVPRKYIRTYYGRMYEAKFLNGMLAGILSRSGRIGYIADYPICGMPANINAFARGARMVNPDARIYVEWSTTLENEGVDLTRKFQEQDIHLISGHDIMAPNRDACWSGLCRFDGTQAIHLARPVWDWGKYYELIIRRIRSGLWEREEGTDGTKALNYWWGMSAGVIDVFWSADIHPGTRKMLEVLKQSLCSRSLEPFFGQITAQDGSLHGIPDGGMAPQEILTMDWLCDNVEGVIPQNKELQQRARGIVSLLGVRRQEDSE